MYLQSTRHHWTRHLGCPGSTRSLRKWAGQQKNVSKKPPRGSAVSWCANMQIHFSKAMSWKLKNWDQKLLRVLCTMVLSCIAKRCKTYLAFARSKQSWWTAPTFLQPTIGLHYRGSDLRKSKIRQTPPKASKLWRHNLIAPCIMQ